MRSLADPVVGAFTSDQLSSRSCPTSGGLRQPGRARAAAREQGKRHVHGQLDVRARRVITVNLGIPTFNEITSRTLDVPARPAG